MSTTIDSKVVEMRFDNKHFESNVKETLSTLDKLKQKLNLTGASKGLENITTSTNKLNMEGLSNAVQTVSTKFSSLQVIGVTALGKITNAAINAGTRITKALVIDPITDGWKEYEMTLNAVQTTMAGTGKTAQEVEKELEKLDTYADKTIYSTADMLNNLPKFTNAGVDLEKATTAMIGIANATALAGGDANKASIAFYNLGQAIGTGYLTRMDYNSINNAGIATMEWKNQMVEAAIAQGTLTKTSDGLYKSGKKTYTLQQLFIDGLQTQWATTDVMMKVFEDYGKEETAIGKKAYDAAQNIKTFSMMMDSLKATAGTGWKNTWQLIFGDLDQATKFWTGLNNFISGIITKMADFRNDLLSSALGKSFTGLLDNVKKSADGVKEVVESVKDYAKVVDEILGGKWGNGQARWDKLTQAGYDWAHAQNLVNEKLGNAKRHATNYQEAQNGVAKTQEELSEATTDYIVSLAELSDSELEAALGGEKQAKAFRELADAADKTGIPLKDFINNIDEIDGRWLLINSFKNLGTSLVTIFKAIGDAWKNAFPPMQGDQLFNIIAGLHKFSETIKNNVNGNAENLTRTLKGLFAIIDIIANVVAGGFKIAFKVLTAVLGAFNYDVLEFTAMIGDAIVKVRDWIENNSLLTKGVTFVATAIASVIKAISDWAKNNETIVNGIKRIKDELTKMSEGLDKWLEGIKQTDNIPKYIAEGLVNGLKSGIKLAVAVMIELGKALLEAICAVLGIHSPSKEFHDIGKNIMIGLAQGLADGMVIVWDMMKVIGNQIISIIKEIDYSKIFGAAVTIGAFGLAKEGIKIVKALTSPIVSFADILKSAKNMFTNFGNGFKNMCDGIGKGAKDIGKGIKRNQTAQALKSLAISIGILAIALYAISKIEPDRLWDSIKAIAALAAILGTLSYAVSKMQNFGKSALSLIGIAVSLTIMTNALRKLSEIDPERLGSAIKALAAVVVGLGVLSFAVSMMKPISLKSVASIILLGLVISGLAVVIKMLSVFDDGGCLTAAKALSTLLLSMSASLVILNFVSKSAMIGLGALALLTLIVAGLAGILALMNGLDVDAAMVSSKALSTLLLSMSGALVLLGIVGLMGPAAFVGIGALATLVASLTVLLVALGALMKIPSLQEFLDTGIDTLIKIATGLGEAIGAFVKGALTQISSGLPEIGSNLSLFMMNLLPFIAGAKLIDDTVLKGVGIIAGAILALTAAELINNVISFLSGGTSFADLGNELSLFMLNALPFIAISKQLDPTIMNGVKSLADAILTLTKADILEAFRFGSSLEKFGSQLGDLGTNLSTFVTNLGTFTESQVTTVDCAGRAIKALAEASNSIPNEGGLWGAICGDNSLATFGDKLPGLGTNLGTFVKNLGTFTEAQVTTADCAGRAIKALAQATNEIPNEGGLWGKLAGDNSLATFGSYLPDLGTNLGTFVTNLGTFTESQVATVQCAGQAIAALATAANELPSEGGIWQKIVGENSLATFSEKLPVLGANLKSFVSELGEFSSESINSVYSVTAAIQAISNLGKIDLENTGSKLEEFGSNMVRFAKKVKDFADKIGKVGSESISSAITKVNDLIGLASTVAGSNIESLKTFGESLKEFAKDGVNGFVDEFSGNDPKSKAKDAVKELVQAGIDGADDKKSDVEDVFGDLAEAAVDEMCTKTLKDDAKQAGKDLVTGFANGIKNNKSLASNAGSAIGKAALKAAKEAIDSNSPSKEAFKLGNFFGEGFVGGIRDYTRAAYNESYAMAENAKSGLSGAIAKVSALIENGIDTQPTIRPVLDLSNVESGAGYLSSMFNGGPSIGVTSNLRAISSGMNSRNQNGTNNDVVSAINKLSKSLGDSKGDTYNLNGITYDDGSNITDAVKTIVRAAVRERRS